MVVVTVAHKQYARHQCHGARKPHGYSRKKRNHLQRPSARISLVCESMKNNKPFTEAIHYIYTLHTRRTHSYTSFNAIIIHLNVSFCSRLNGGLMDGQRIVVEAFKVFIGRFSVVYFRVRLCTKDDSFPNRIIQTYRSLSVFFFSTTKKAKKKGRL